MTVAGYYDTWGPRLLEDYDVRNQRVVAALDFANILKPGRLLDVGCGIGWSSSKLADDGHTVTGIDISPALTEIATRTFGDRCEFHCVDFTEGLDDQDGFDSVAMIDVYEHFPVDSRPRVHANLARLLRPGGQILLTAPTPELHQAARASGLEMQPVDEDVSVADLERLAEDTNTRIVVQRRVGGLSSGGDYWHVLCERA